MKAIDDDDDDDDDHDDDDDAAAADDDDRDDGRVVDIDDVLAVDVSDSGTDSYTYCIRTSASIIEHDGSSSSSSIP